jgi:hypothetical protein
VNTVAVFTGKAADVVKAYGPRCLYALSLGDQAKQVERKAAAYWACATMWDNPECFPSHMRRPDLKERDMWYARQGYAIAAWLRALEAASARVE